MEVSTFLRLNAGDTLFVCRKVDELPSAACRPSGTH